MRRITIAAAGVVLALGACGSPDTGGPGTLPGQYDPALESPTSTVSRDTKSASPTPSPTATAQADWLAGPVVCVPGNGGDQLHLLDASYRVIESRSLPTEGWPGCREYAARTSVDSPTRWWAFSPGFSKVAITQNTNVGRAAGYVDLVTGETTLCSVTPEKGAFSTTLPDDRGPFFLSDGSLVFLNEEVGVLRATPPCTTAPQPVTGLNPDFPSSNAAYNGGPDTWSVALSSDGWPIAPFHPDAYAVGVDYGMVSVLNAGPDGVVGYRGWSTDGGSDNFGTCTWVTPQERACQDFYGVYYPVTKDTSPITEAPRLTPATDQTIGSLAYSEKDSAIIFPAHRAGESAKLYSIPLTGGEPRVVREIAESENIQRWHWWRVP